MRSSLTFFISIISTFCYSQINHWESVVLPGDYWFYKIPSSQPNSSWNLLYFDDSNWSQGMSGFGYGDDDDATLVPENTISIYMRKTLRSLKLMQSTRYDWTSTMMMDSWRISTVKK